MTEHDPEKVKRMAKAAYESQPDYILDYGMATFRCELWDTISPVARERWLRAIRSALAAGESWEKENGNETK